MNRLFFTAAAALMLLCPALAHAEGEIDVAKVTCADFVKQNEKSVYGVFWMEGYLSSKSENYDMNPAYIEEFSKALVENCKKNPNKTLMSVAKGVKVTVKGEEKNNFFKMPCKVFNQDPPERKGTSIAWIDGFLAGTSGTTVIDDDWKKSLVDHLTEYCSANEDKTIQDAVSAMQ